MSGRLQIGLRKYLRWLNRNCRRRVLCATKDQNSSRAHTNDDGCNDKCSQFRFHDRLNQILACLVRASSRRLLRGFGWLDGWMNGCVGMKRQPGQPSAQIIRSASFFSMALLSANSKVDSPAVASRIGVSRAIRRAAFFWWRVRHETARCRTLFESCVLRCLKRPLLVVAAAVRP